MGGVDGACCRLVTTPGLAFLSRAVSCPSPSRRTSSGSVPELGKTHLSEKILCFLQRHGGSTSMGGHWPDTAGHGGGEELALEATRR